MPDKPQTLRTFPKDTSFYQIMIKGQGAIRIPATNDFIQQWRAKVSEAYSKGGDLASNYGDARLWNSPIHLEGVHPEGEEHPLPPCLDIMLCEIQGIVRDD